MELTRRSFVQGAAAAAAGVAASSLLTTAEPSVAAAEVPADAVMKPGRYFGAAYGYSGQEPVHVMVEVDENSILSIQVIEKQHVYEQPLILQSAEDWMIPRMIENQSFGVQVTTGATFSSFAIKNAVEDAIKQAYVAAGFPAEAAAKFDVDVPQEGGFEELEYDVVVCGLGGAGVSAAMTVAEEQSKAGKPVSVIAFETAAKYGGCCANGMSVFAANPPENQKNLNNGEDYMDIEAVYEDWMNLYGQGEDNVGCKPELVRKYLEESGPTLDWLCTHGYMFSASQPGLGMSAWVKGAPQYLSGSNQKPDIDYASFYPGFAEHDFDTTLYYNNIQYWDAIMKDYQDLGGIIQFETEARELVFDESGKKIVGLRAFDNITGKEYLVHCKAVIMCTGGFLGNPEMTKKYMKNPWYPFDGAWTVYGMMQSKGTLIESAIENGVATYNIDMSPLTHTSVPAGTIHDYPIRYYDGKDSMLKRQNTYTLNDLPFILGTAKNCMKVIDDGLRHFDENTIFAFWKAGPYYYSIYGEDFINQLETEGLPGKPGTYTRASFGGMGGYANAVPIYQMHDIMEKGIEQGFIWKGDTPEELAEAVGFPPEDFAAQVERYRGYCESKVDEEFNKAEAQLPQTIGNNGPYYAIKVVVRPYATTAALDVDVNANCLFPDGTPVEGLYACGVDSGGVLESNARDYAQYGGVAQGWAYTSGHLAGKHAVATLL
ncbi:MAG: FAD-binding protein [Coriobacteriales bacterium]|nr:FAD-binding protein [Coriobacteriales bacterium]